MKLWKRLAAGLLAAVTAIGATIGAGAADITLTGYVINGSIGESRVQTENGYYVIGRDFTFYHGETKEILETISNPGIIENPGNPETEKPVLIPASELENYPVGTVMVVNSDSDLSNALYIRDPERTDYYQSIGVGSFSNGVATKYFVLTEKMKERGLLLTGYAEQGVEEITIENKSITILSLTFTAAVAKEYLYSRSTVFESMKEPIAIDWAPNAKVSGLPLASGAYIPAEVFENVPVGSVFECNFDTTQQLPIGENVFRLKACVSELMENPIGDGVIWVSSEYDCRLSISQYPPSITDNSEPDAETEFYNRGVEPLNFTVTEDVKASGITFFYKNDEEAGIYLSDLRFKIIDENSDIFSSSTVAPVDPVDPVVTPGFSTPAGETSVKEVPLGTVVTQKTAVDDTTGRYGARFVKKVAASDIEGKTKATFTLSNGTTTKTVSTTKYNTALTVDGETLSAGSGYVFLVYTLSGIPEDVTITVGNVVLE